MEPIAVKIIARGKDAFAWKRQSPGMRSTLGECRFLWEKDATGYDWLVVIDDVSRRLRAPPERLQCPDENTLLVTSEPPTITRYGPAFCAQFAHVLTSHPPEALRHPNRHESHTGNLWFNGHSYDELADKPFPTKTRRLSTVCSAKRQQHTIHRDRYRFTHWLKTRIPDLEVFGHGWRYIEHKFEALDAFRFHLAIENHVAPHHWTEKLADPFLSGAFPIYYGCTNVRDYFPPESFLEIDLFQPKEALEKIRSAVGNPDFYPSRVEALHEARRRVLREHNLLFMIERLVRENHHPNARPSHRPLFGRKQMRVRHPGDAAGHLAWLVKRRLRTGSGAPV